MELFHWALHSPPLRFKHNNEPERIAPPYKKKRAYSLHTTYNTILLKNVNRGYDEAEKKK
jgi:hypothetical protein